MGTALTTINSANLTELQNLGQIFVKSKFFADSTDAAHAIVKIMAGAELGFAPIASMTGVYIVKGKVSLSANLMAAAIKRSKRYTFRCAPGHPTAHECEITFYEREGDKWAPIGTSSFTIAEAHAANLHRDWDYKANNNAGGWKDKPTWKNFPKNMLFARALSNGAKWFCADIFGGPVYTPDELGATVDGETGEVIDLAPEPKTVHNVALQVEPAAAKAEIARAVEVDSQDDPLPEFEQRQSEESPEEIEAERSTLTAQIKQCFLVCKSEGEFIAWWQEVRGDDRPRPWLRSMATTLCERAAAFKAANAEPKAEEVFDGQKPAAKPSHAAQAADGSVKLLRKDASGNLVPQWEKPTPSVVEDDPAQVLADTAAQGYATPSHKRLDELITFWNREGFQSFEAINQKIAAVTGGKYALDELDEAEAAKVCGALSNWNPTADAAIGKKGAKKK